MLFVLLVAATPLTDAEQAEKERLLNMGFVEWNRKDLRAFVNAYVSFVVLLCAAVSVRLTCAVFGFT